MVQMAGVRAGGCIVGLLWGHRFSSRTCGVGRTACIKALSAVELGRTAATRCDGTENGGRDLMASALPAKQAAGRCGQL